MRAIALLLVALAAPLAGQVRPSPGPGDPRLQTVTYNANQIIQLPVAVGYQLTVELSPGERIENAALGDTGGWQVTANKRGDRLFIKRQSGGGATNLTVMTDARTYAFDLVPDEGSVAPYIVRFVYLSEAPPPAASATAQPELNNYGIRGDKAIWPSAMGDDGTRTYIEWEPDAAMPAVFAIDETGQEVTVDGYVRNGRYVIDSVKSKLIFRLGNDMATAERNMPKTRK